MNNITIGITARNEKIGDTIYQIVSQNILKYIDNKANYIGLLTHTNNHIDIDVLKKCDAIIIGGGNNIYPYHYELVEYATNNNIPLLGICMGSQILGLTTQNNDESKLIKVNNHNKKNSTHKVNIEEGSILYRLFGKTISTNTRHDYALEKVNYPFKIIARSEDGVIEAIENTENGNYQLALQWHPEDMDNMEAIFIDFIRETLLRKINKSL